MIEIKQVDFIGMKEEKRIKSACDEVEKCMEEAYKIHKETVTRKWVKFYESDTLSL